ncbi:MAG: hypothetical protein PHN80_16375 [Hespellia sp.]|nr:hypothetical protein [Hespellia sp.]
MVRKEYIPKVHLRNTKEMTECGIEIKDSIHATDDESLVTCANCARTIITKEAEKKKYPYLVLSKNSITLNIGPDDQQHSGLELSSADILDWYDAVIQKEKSRNATIQEKKE